MQKSGVDQPYEPIEANSTSAEIVPVTRRRSSGNPDFRCLLTKGLMEREFGEQGSAVTHL